MKDQRAETWFLSQQIIHQNTGEQLSEIITHFQAEKDTTTTGLLK